MARGIEGILDILALLLEGTVQTGEADEVLVRKEVDLRSRKNVDENQTKDVMQETKGEMERKETIRRTKVQRRVLARRSQSDLHLHLHAQTCAISMSIQWLVRLAAECLEMSF
jgi:hypothetical protein